MTAKRSKRTPPAEPAQKKRTATPAAVENVPAPTGREIIQDQPPAEIRDEIGELLAALGPDGGQLILSRRTETGKWAYVGTLGATGFSAALVQDRFGGGEYRIHARKARGGQTVGSRVVEIAALPPGAQNGAEGALLRELLAELRTVRQPAAMDPMQLAIQMQQVAATQMTTLVGLLEALRSKDAPAAAAPALENQVSILRDLLDLAPKLLRNGPRDDGGSSLDKYLPGIFDLLRGMQRPPLPVPAPAPQPQTQDGAPVNPIWAQLAPHVPHLIALAQTHGDPALWADVIQERAPAAVRAIEAMQRTPESLADEFCVVYPAAAPHREWFVGLLAELMTPDPAETSE